MLNYVRKKVNNYRYTDTDFHTAAAEKTNPDQIVFLFVTLPHDSTTEPNKDNADAVHYDDYP